MSRKSKFIPKRYAIRMKKPKLPKNNLRGLLSIFDEAKAELARATEAATTAKTLSARTEAHVWVKRAEMRFDIAKGEYQREVQKVAESKPL